MLEENLSFFEKELSQETIAFYLELSKRLSEGEGDLEALYLESFVRKSIRKNLRLNVLDRMMILINHYKYYIWSLLMHDNDLEFEESLEWCSRQIENEKECTISLKKSLLYLLKTNEVLLDLFLVDYSYAELRRKRVEIWNQECIRFNSMGSGYEYEPNLDYNREEIEKGLNKVKEYSRVLRRWYN